MNEMDLKPCPFCGARAEIRIQKVEYGIIGTIIRCTNCTARIWEMDSQGAVVNGILKNVPVENHTQLAIDAWNRRI